MRTALLAILVVTATAHPAWAQHLTFDHPTDSASAATLRLTMPQGAFSARAGRPAPILLPRAPLVRPGEETRSPWRAVPRSPRLTRRAAIAGAFIGIGAGLVAGIQHPLISGSQQDSAVLGAVIGGLIGGYIGHAFDR